MKKVLFILILILCSRQGYSQTPPSDNSPTIDLGSLNLSPDQEKKMNAAFAVMDAVEKAGAYIKSLSELITNGTVPLPVGIKKGDYTVSLNINQSFSIKDLNDMIFTLKGATLDQSDCSCNLIIS